MKSIEQVELAGRRVLIRVDFNVPIQGGEVADATRIENALPTIRYALAADAKVILASHLGRPKGESRPELALAPVAGKLRSMLGPDVRVTMAGDCVGPAVEALVDKMHAGDVLMLENLRFHSGETANDPAFAAALGRLADVYVNDAFGTAHRAHASTTSIVGHVPQVAAGFLMLKEIKFLSGLLVDPPHPFVAIIGGAKVSDKIELMANLLSRVDSVLVGGAMAYTFLKSQGHNIGSSRVEDDKLELAAKLLEDAERESVSVELPGDHIAATEFSRDAARKEIAGTDIPEGLMGLDIGPKTIARYREVIAGAATIFWNGPMGVFEWDTFARGTLEVANAVADSPAQSFVGGGDSVAALSKSGRSEDITHISTGGGASLEFLEGRTLPGIAALESKGR